MAVGGQAKGSDVPLDRAALSAVERGVVERLVASLEDELAGDLRAIWLYGSRARGDASIGETDPDLRSDVDLMVVAEGGRRRHDAAVHDLVSRTVVAAGESPVWFSALVVDPEWVRGRREIESFFSKASRRSALPTTRCSMRLARLCPRATKTPGRTAGSGTSSASDT
jgi:predicted nucleotidyltransferase